MHHLARQTGVIALANQTAVDVWNTVEQVPSVSEACRRLSQSWGLGRAATRSYVKPLLAEWERAGLLVEPRAVPVRRAIGRRFEWERTYRFGSRAVRVRAEAQPCGVILDRVLSCLSETEASGAEIVSGTPMRPSSI